MNIFCRIKSDANGRNSFMPDAIRRNSKKNLFTICEPEMIRE